MKNFIVGGLSMSILKEIRIDSKKRYLVISKSPTFLLNARRTIEKSLNISDVYDTKSAKNSMTFNTIIFKDGGFIKFVLYDEVQLICSYYDVVLADDSLYASHYIDIRKECLMAQIYCIDSDISIELEDVKPDIYEVIDRKYDVKLGSDYGECPVCKAVIREVDETCPICKAKLNWIINKDIILERCKLFYDDKEGDIKAICGNDIIYDIYYNLTCAFTYEELEKMSEKEVLDLVKLASVITGNTY